MRQTYTAAFPHEPTDTEHLIMITEHEDGTGSVLHSYTTDGGLTVTHLMRRTVSSYRHAARYMLLYLKMLDKPPLPR